ncbi:hypothetical protein SELMODRAFT_431748 [Selaginella moellendorffii]|uniref:Cilia- and flagella-associated protein 157 n=1 Tax=Selaginella moellendorffii TaxID=88036 RepID=D8TDN2_SELML|nr:hypothetical protein SELMODRAFT_431748 [Selaginella moellendorffii]
MAPKKGGKGGKKKDEGPVEDEVTILKRKVGEREAEILQLLEKLKALEEESQKLAGSILQIRSEAVERGEKFNDIIIYLTGEVKIKGEKAGRLEKELTTLKAEKTESAEALAKEIQDMRHGCKFILEDLRLQLDNAQVQLRDLNEFTMTKQALEQETKSLKEQLEREKKEHQESISDVERATLQERERLKKEMAVRIEDTRKLMIKQAHEQLHALEDDLIRRNGTYQKTMRMLVFKLREKYLANKMERKMEEEDLEQLLGRNEALKEDVRGEKKQLEKIKEVIEEKSAAAECTGPAEAAMKFLYGCIQDLEVERLLKARTDECCNSAEDTVEEIDAWPHLPTSLDKLNFQQRKRFLKHLIRTAISLRVASRNFESLDHADKQDLEASFSMWTEAKETKKGSVHVISVEDILSLPLGSMQLDDSTVPSTSFWIRPTSSGTQTYIKDILPMASELF